MAVIVPHYNDLKRLGSCLEALAPQIAAAGDVVETVVVDNDSPVDLSDLQAAHPNVRFVIEARKGAAAARNRGVEESSAPYLAFLDSDCVPQTDWLVTALELTGQAPVIGGRVDTFDETPAPRSGAEAFETVFAFKQRDYIEQKGFSVTANLVTSRAVFEAVGPFIVGLSEDMDWCFRATAQGNMLAYADELQVSHPTRQDWHALAKKWRRTTLEGFHLNGTPAHARVRWGIRAFVVAASGIAHIPKVLGCEALTTPERYSGIGTLVRLRLARAVWMLQQAVTGR